MADRAAPAGPRPRHRARRQRRSRRRSRPGEIVGLAGLDGHGQERFLEDARRAGSRRSAAVVLDAAGASRTITSFRKAVASGIAYLPRDRRATGIFPDAVGARQFRHLDAVGRDTRLGLISPAAAQARYEIYREKLSIVAPRPDAPITTLSGGNQQKVLLARALALEPGVLLAQRSDPRRRRGDAARALRRLPRAWRADGMALVILSSEIEEILLLCHRVLVFRENAGRGRDRRRGA